MKLRPEEITSILKQRIETFDVETDLAEVGTVLQVGDGIARIYGLENCVAMEMLELEHGVVGLAFNLEEDDVGAALFGTKIHLLSQDPTHDETRLREALSSTAVHVQAIAVRPLSLEDVFVHRVMALERQERQATTGVAA